MHNGKKNLLFMPSDKVTDCGVKIILLTYTQNSITNYVLVHKYILINSE